MSYTLAWLLAAIAFLGFDLAAPHLVTLFFGFGALAGMFAHLLGFALEAQIIVFIICSLLSLALLRSKLRKVFSGRIKSEGEGGEDAPRHPLSGQTARVTRACGPGRPGEVEVGGSFWRATGTADMPEGTLGTVVGAEGGDSLTLRVAPREPSPAA